MLDERVRAVLARLEEEDAREREEGVARELRARQVARSTGQFLFALVAPQSACEVLEIGGSRGYSSIWLGAGVRYFGGRVLSLEADPAKAEAWGRNVAEAGLEETVELVEGNAFETLPQIDDVFDVVFIDAEKEDYEQLFLLSRDKVEPGALVVADNVLSHVEAARCLLRGPEGRPDDRECHHPARPRPRALGDPVGPPVAQVLRRRLGGAAQRPYRLSRCGRPHRAATVAITAERRWSGLTDSSTGSGGTSG